jgi:hypothetical protein
MTELKEYIRKSVEAGLQNQEASRQARINFYKEKVEELYRLVNENLLADLHEEGLFHVSYEDEDIVEEGLGRYNTRSMLIKMGALNVELRPYGTMVIGARGRVDMWVNNNEESAMLILVPATADTPQKPIIGTEQEWVWKMVERKVSKVSYTPLTSDMFQKKILSLASLYV